MRVFIGIKLSQFSNLYYKELSDEIKKYCSKGKFHNLDNYHMTLYFIGNVDEDKLVQIKNICEEVSKNIKKFSVSTGILNSFDKKNRKILWFGLSYGSLEIQNLYKLLRDEFKKHGFEIDECFIPHLTIGRNVLLDNIDLAEISDRLNYREYKSEISELILFESKRVSDVLIYDPISKFEFKD